MKDSAVIAGFAGVVGILGAVPYLASILKGSARPNLVTWGVWTFLNVMAVAAALGVGAIETAIYAFGNTLATGAIVALGWKTGTRRLTTFDLICLGLALLGLALWGLTGHAALAVVFDVAVNLVAVLPTVVHAWSAPREEVVTAYAIGIAGALLALAAQPSFRWIAAAIPLVIVLNNGSVVAVALARRGGTGSAAAALENSPSCGG